MEFTFSTWIFVEDYEYRKGKWKHVFHKGNASSWPNRCPGVWLHPNDNALRVYLNTYNDVSNHVDIDNIPIAKWFTSSTCTPVDECCGKPFIVGSVLGSTW